MREIRHGTANEYSNHGCRCAECRNAWRIYSIQYYAKRKRKPFYEPRQYGKLDNARMPWPDGYFDLRTIALEQRRD